VLVLSLIIVGLVFPHVGVVHAQERIYIREDGSIEGTDNIQCDGDIYTFTDDISERPIYVERNNVVIDGAGHTLQGADGRGIVLSEVSNVTVKNVNLEMEGGYGIYLVNASNCMVANNTITGYGYNIYLWDSFNNTVTGNTITNAFCGILIYHSAENFVNANEVTDGIVGIELHDCLHNVLRNNQMENNSHSFSVRIYPLYNYDNDVDVSNTVDGSPIYYWVGETDRTVPSDAGCAVLVNCTHITVQDLHLSVNCQGIMLVSTTESIITQNFVNCPQSGNGIVLIHSSHNNITENTVQHFSTGIQLEESSYNTISRNTVAYNDRGIRPLYNSKHNTISGNTITANNYGIDDGQEPSGDNIVTENLVSANGFGVSLHSASNTISGNTVTENSNAGILIGTGSNTIIENNVTDNWQGIYIGGSNNVLRNNRMKNNDNNFVPSMGFTNDVDTSNTVEGKPIIYWVSQHDKIVPYDAGYVVLVNCVNVTVEKLALSYNGEGILLSNTVNSTIKQNVISNMSKGIRFYGASDNQIFCNNITNNSYGVYFSGGGYLSTYYPSPDNTFYNNNFVNNEEAVHDIAVNGSPWIESGALVNNWDNGTIGNYWSNYNGTDQNGDGISDSAYILYKNNQDNFPLMTPVTVEIPEFPSWVILPLFLVATLFVMITKKKISVLSVG
jgi:parallel beta-helix repeat protein